MQGGSGLLFWNTGLVGWLPSRPFKKKSISNFFVLLRGILDIICVNSIYLQLRDTIVYILVNESSPNPILTSGGK